jgi:nucleoside-diphosphate-sugar epimerase
MKKVLVMGGSYFIGKHVVHALKNHYEVYVLNRGNKPFSDPLVHELICDRNNESQMKDILSPYEFHYIIDISAYTALHLNILIESLKLSLLEKFVFISTSAAYNIEIGNAPFKESDALGGESPAKEYAKNKIEAEQYVSSVLSEDQLVIFRPPVVYGEDNYVLRERLIYYLIENDLPVYIPKSNNHLSLVYVKDVAQEVKLAFEGVIPPGIYNLGNKDPLTFTEWVHLCAKVMHKSANIMYIDQKLLSIDVRLFFPYIDIDGVLSVEKIKTYSPNETDFETGLTNAYNDYLNLEEHIQLPEKMQAARALIEANPSIQHK